jgi:sugar phosphate isomerase/epimerase
MTTISRRTLLSASLSVPLVALGARAASAAGRMTLALHQNTSSAAGYRKSLEGWARAGITQVELTGNLVDDFLKTDTIAGARQLLSDLGLTPVHASVGGGQLIAPNDGRARALENLKRGCETFAQLGLKAVYTTTGTTQKVTADDYKAAPANIREAGEVVKQFGLSLRIEFVRTSTFISTLPTMLKVTREAGHPSVSTLFDCYHFWSGLNKLADLDLVKPGEIGHVHFQDVPDMPRELLDTTTRAIPGDGVSPLTTILEKLKAKGYAGPLSVELFGPRFQQADPFEVASEIKRKAEAVMRRARVV